MKSRFSLDLNQLRLLLSRLDLYPKSQLNDNQILGKSYSIKLPITLHELEPAEFEAWLNEERQINSLFVLVQAGSAAIGSSNEGIIQYHKVFKRYMIRKSQGKAQLKHLKTKGKSRLGSRIRLQQSAKFFEEIEEKILQLEQGRRHDLVLFSAASSIVPFLFTNESCINKNDSRLRKVPLDLDTPNYAVLKYVNKYAHKSIIETEDPELVNWINQLTTKG